MKGLFVDTSVLIAGSIDLGSGSAAALALLDSVADGAIPPPMTAWHCCLEFFSVTTRLPEEYRVSPPDALLLLDEILERFEVTDLPARRRRSFFEEAVRDQISGGRIYDAHIAEIARLSKAEVIVTENRRDFTTLLQHGIRVVDARTIMKERGWKGR